MNERVRATYSPHIVLLFLFFAVAVAWMWAGSSLAETHAFAVRGGDTGGPLVLALCVASLFPAAFVWGLVVLCDRSAGTIRVLALLSAMSALLTVTALLLLFLLPLYAAVGDYESRGFPWAFPPYAWGVLGSALHWLAISIVFPYGPYFGCLPLAVLLFDLCCRRQLFSRRAQAAGWLITVGCVIFFYVIISQWEDSLFWFYRGPYT